MEFSSSSLYLFIFTFFIYSVLVDLVIARGGEGEHSFNHSGSVDHSHGRHLFGETPPSVDLSHGYMSNTELEKAMKQFAHKCSAISRLYSIGKSVNGVNLWVLEISDNPGIEEPEPAFKFIGNVHGDEPVGRELLMHLANWLCNNYMTDPLATLIIKNVHLHILPTMNPDGYSLKKRGNANNIDLNRDFPDQFFSVNNDLGLRQPETKAIMSWLKKIHFTASATLHGGALVANFPWDGSENQNFILQRASSGKYTMHVLMTQPSGTWQVFIAVLTITCLLAKNLTKELPTVQLGILYMVVCKIGTTYMQAALN